ncbi:SGNH/GDSL hydrolase family protein [Paludisphaera sp.]|uniref:SGNH/GDSL hydrolase family protein n=1 Tax=Paludisphaera sp. TaxID=2017432 RepID=UPI00301DC356
MPRSIRTVAPALLALMLAGPAQAAEPAWTYRPEAMRPFWEGEVMEGESVLFVKDGGQDTATASVLMPIRKILAVRNAAGDVTYEEGRDYAWAPGSREITLPAGSRIVASRPEDLRRPPGSQPYRLTHRDGGDEIMFGGKLEYHALQTIVTYEHDADAWDGPRPPFDPAALPRSVAKLEKGEPLSIVVLGDSISTGCNASGWADGAPFQPAYHDLLRLHLRERFGSDVRLANLSVGGMDTAWALTMIDKVVEAEPDIVIVAFGMNDSAGRPAAEYRDNIARVMSGVREGRPDAEFILVATMIGNPDWVALRQELFPAYRDALAGLRAPGVALADLTSIWSRFLALKRDRELTGNGVNHPNDFGHRVYAQTIAAALSPPR